MMTPKPVAPAYDRITVDPAVMNGQPCIRGTRITLRRVLDLVATYADRTELRREFPELTEADIKQALAFASANLPDQSVELVKV